MFGKPFAGSKGRSRHLKLPYAPQGSLIGFLLHKYNPIVIARRSTMKKTRIAIATIFLLCTVGGTVLTSEASTTFAGAIVGIDQAQRTITFQTRDGQTWTLPVADSNILKQEQIAKGDRVRIEVDLSGNDLSERITKITKIREGQLFEPTQSLNEVRP
jgi:hypothetical protein